MCTRGGLGLTSFWGYHRPTVLPLRGRPGSELSLKLRDSEGRLEWTLKGVIMSGSGNYEGASHPVLGSAGLSNTTPTCKQHTGRVVTNGVQQLQHIKSRRLGSESRAWLR